MDDFVDVLIIEYCSINTCQSIGSIDLKSDIVSTPIGWQLEEPDIDIILDEKQ